MSEQKIIAVVGATGSQGGGVVEAILADPDGQFTARALTRDPSSERAQEFARRGAEVVNADLGDESSLRKAFDGAYGAYVVTNYWEQRPTDDGESRAELELAQAQNAARAAKEAGVAHVIWSTLEDTRDHFGADERVPTVEGTYKVPHFDAKAEADELFTGLGVPATFLRTTFYFDGFLQGTGPARGEDGKLALTLPLADAPLAGIASEDIGKTALGIFRRGDEFIGRTVSIAGDHLTGEQLAAVFAKVLGEEVVYRPVDFDTFRSYPTPVAVEMGNMFQYYAEAADRFIGDRDLDLVRELNPELQSFETWLGRHRAELQLD
jgi:uncharacterized protein YbjT (DUF2867 family)